MTHVKAGLSWQPPFGRPPNTRNWEGCYVGRAVTSFRQATSCSQIWTVLSPTAGALHYTYTMDQSQFTEQDQRELAQV